MRIAEASHHEKSVDDDMDDRKENLAKKYNKLDGEATEIREKYSKRNHTKPNHQILLFYTATSASVVHFPEIPSHITATSVERSENSALKANKLRQGLYLLSAPDGSGGVASQINKVVRSTNMQKPFHA